MNLCVNPVVNFSRLLDVKQINSTGINFGRKSLTVDTFEKRCENKTETETLKLTELRKNSPELYKRICNGEESLLSKTKLLNRQTGEYEDAYITEHQYGIVLIYAKDKNLGSVIFSEGGSGIVKREDLTNASEEYKQFKFIEIDNLETENKGQDETKYRGIGTALLKQAVTESKNKGFKGRIALVAGNYTGIGRPAESFYLHVGLKQCNDGINKPVFILREQEIENFLKK